MRVVVPLDFRFNQAPDGSVWTDTSYEYGFWLRYLDVFDGVRVVGRARQVSSIGANWKRVDGGGVTFHPVPHYLGPWQYLLRAAVIKAAAHGAFTRKDAVILRVPAQVSTCFAGPVLQSKHPYGVEVLGDPYEAFQRGSVEHPLRPIFRWWYTRQLKRQCVHASALAYVAEYLERRYPSGGRAVSLPDVDLPDDALAFSSKVPTTNYSSVELQENSAVPVARSQWPENRTCTLITIASLAQVYKGTDALVEALGRCPVSGLDLRLRIIGDGKHRPQLEARTAALGLAARVCFLGQLPAGDAIREELDQADLFVLPSKTEGLPRAMIEAMARGLPCIGSAVGGIPELLPPEDLVPPGDVVALAGKIMEVATDARRLTAMSTRNLEKAREYSENVLRPRRRAFYEYVRKVTENWVRAGIQAG
jgi:glycosyltransferase involved in cell wall biosynthesis